MILSSVCCVKPPWLSSATGVSPKLVPPPPGMAAEVPVVCWLCESSRSISGSTALITAGGRRQTLLAVTYRGQLA